MPDLTRALLDNSTRYSFIQAYRLLKLLFSRLGEADEDTLLEGIKVRPDLSLSFPPHDIISISKTLGVRDKYSITATFLGLYGASSPLPTFYTEDLMAEASEDSTVTRDFLDILSGPVYHHFFECWAKYRLFYQLVENPDSDTMERLYCLSGFASDKVRDCFEDPYGLLRYLGLTTQIPRPADGLRVLLADALHEPGLSIEQFVSKHIEIPEDQRMVLGTQAASLGEDTCLGTRVIDCTGQFRVHVEDVGADRFLGLLPDQPLFRKMGGLISFYVDQPLSWDVEITVDPDEIEPCSLGRPEWSRLGWDTWLGQIESPGENVVRFTPPS